MKRALISVYHKTGIDQAARLLRQAGWEIISTGGTAAFLKEQGIEVSDVATMTGFPEILDGRVKTLHPHVFAPLLARKSRLHLQQLKKLGLAKIDLLLVNFYPFEEALNSGEKDPAVLLEKIDVGGPAMVRAAAKNFPDTIVVVDEADYLPVVEAIHRKNDIPLEWRRRLAQKAFSYTAFYDSLIADFLQGDDAEVAYKNVAGRLRMNLRYGENPHQRAALFGRDRRSPFYDPQLLQGKELSFNNILDAAMVYEAINSFAKDDPVCVIVKHQNPCGAALAESQEQAFSRALSGDPQAAFGGIVGFNQTLGKAAAERLSDIFLEVIVAPDFSPPALTLLAKKKNLRLIKAPLGYQDNNDLRYIPGGFLWQRRDLEQTPPEKFVCRSGPGPTAAEKADLDFGWKLIKYVKSNGILIVKGRMLLGVGAGQMSRVDSVDLAIRKSRIPLAGAVLLSDGFFPFADSIEIAAKNGIKVVAEPGGSIRDDEVIAAAAKLGVTLLFTGIRHFRH